MDKKRVVVITGGAGGIGQAVAKKFLGTSTRVVLVDYITPTILMGLQLTKDGFGYYINDVTDANDVQGCAQAILEREGRIDVLVNAVGIMSKAPKPIVKMDMDELAEQWDRNYQVNLRGPVLWCRAVLPAMREQNYGRIVNICSVMSFSADPGNDAYAAMKAGLASFTRGLAVQAPFNSKGEPFNICINGVAPGIIETPMTDSLPEKAASVYRGRSPLRRFGKPDEVATVVHFLASDKNTHMNGSILPVDGGWLAAA